jgi:phosphomannomutase
VTTDPIKVYDARWLVSEFDDVAVQRLFEATFLYGSELGATQVVLCRDARLGAARVLELAMDTARRQGFDVILCPDPVGTTLCYFATLVASEATPGTLGLMITASHNPKEYIGVKFTVPVVRAIGLGCGPKGGLERIRELYHGNVEPPRRTAGRLEIADFRERYRDHAAHVAAVTAGSLRGLKVVLDAFHGSSGPELFSALSWAGAEVILLRLLPNGDFPTGSPNPTSIGKMDRACALARETNASIVIGVDGDGDRIVFGDHRGILSAGLAFVPMLEHGMAQLGNPKNVPVLYDPKVSPVALALWSSRGAAPALYRNGHSQIKDHMLRIDARFGAEESGHYYHVFEHGGHRVAAENALVSIFTFLAHTAKHPNAMDELFALQARVFTTGEFNYQFASDAVRDEALISVVAYFCSLGADARRRTELGNDLGGVRVSRGARFENGNAELAADWLTGFFRIATNEAAVVRSYLSAGDRGLGQSLEEDVRELLEQRFGGRVID